jgi:hypothetical protein
MKKHRSIVHLIVFVLCFGLCGSLVTELEAAPRKKRSSSRSAGGRKQSSRAKGRSSSRSARGSRKRGGRRERVSSRRGRRGSRGVARSTSGPGRGYYDLPIEDRNLLNAINDAEQAGAKIEDSELRAHVKFLSDDLLEGRGTGARGGLLAAKYIAA